MSQSPPMPLEPSLALFDRSTELVLDRLSHVTDADLDRPTPCPDWSLRTLILHLADDADGFTAAITSGEPHSSSERTETPDPVTYARERIYHLLDVMGSATDGDARAYTDDLADRARNTAYGGAVEFTTHAWDIDIACGVEPRIADDHAADVLALSSSLLDDDSRGTNFAPRVEIAATTSPVDHLVAFLGRQPAQRP